MQKKIVSIELSEYNDIAELDEQDQLLVREANSVLEKSYSPYSRFRVGAALLLANGQIITGNNQENAAYPSGLCAERVAIFYANAQFPDVPVVALAVTARRQNSLVQMPVPPCGGCRQVILETESRFGRPIKVNLAGNQSVQVLENAASLLPLSFDANWLSE